MKQEDKIRTAIEEIMKNLDKGMKEAKGKGYELDTIAQLNATTAVAMQSLQTIQLTRLADTMEDIHETLVKIKLCIRN